MCTAVEPRMWTMRPLRVPWRTDGIQFAAQPCSPMDIDGDQE